MYAGPPDQVPPSLFFSPVHIQPRLVGRDSATVVRSSPQAPRAAEHEPFDARGGPRLHCDATAVAWAPVLTVRRELADMTRLAAALPGIRAAAADVGSSLLLHSIKRDSAPRIIPAASSLTLTDGRFQWSVIAPAHFAISGCITVYGDSTMSQLDSTLHLDDTAPDPDGVHRQFLTRLVATLEDLARLNRGPAHRAPNLDTPPSSGPLASHHTETRPAIASTGPTLPAGQTSAGARVRAHSVPPRDDHAHHESPTLAITSRR